MMVKNIFAYSYRDFEDLAKQKGWINGPEEHSCIISIVSPNDEKPNHLFKTNDNVYNLDVDDISPYWFDEKFNYYGALSLSSTLSLYLDGHIEESNKCFDYEFDNVKVHAMNYEEAFKLAKYIDNKINNGVSTIYVHCSAGMSRSQAIVRYILDTYSDVYKINTRRDNPCITPNQHMVLMLKRAYRFSNDF